eukprot:gene11887-8172_t
MEIEAERSELHDVSCGTIEEILSVCLWCDVPQSMKDCGASRPLFLLTQQHKRQTKLLVTGWEPCRWGKQASCLCFSCVEKNRERSSGIISPSIVSPSIVISQLLSLSLLIF